MNKIALGVLGQGKDLSFHKNVGMQIKADWGVSFNLLELVEFTLMFDGPVCFSKSHESLVSV